jgi:hypothetical protein
MISVIAFTQKLLAARNRSTDIGLRRKSRGPLRFAFPFQDWRRAGKIIERKVDFGGHLGQKDYLSCMRRNGKRNHNRFPFFCLQVCRKLVDHILTGSLHSGAPFRRRDYKNVRDGHYIVLTNDTSQYLTA